MQFLAGQTHEMNGGHQLAEAYWRRAADLHDVDGMATWGRRLWVTSPKDRATVTRARDLLEAAAKAGSVTAMQDLAELYSDGQALPVDAAAARRWQAMAQQHQKEPSA